MIHSNNARGFRTIDFEDRYDQSCSMEDAIWFGVNDADPKIMAVDAKRLGIPTAQNVGWIPFHIPEEVLLSTRMHLTRDQVEEILPILQHFVDTGELP
jgi:hypothetical protein